MVEENKTELLALTAQIVGAYVEKNPVPAQELPALIDQVSGSISGLGGKPQEPPQSPAVPVKRSVRHDRIVCLEDGKTFKSLRRHLQAEHGLTPQEYREKWNLPKDYPMVAPDYSAARSEMAKSMGLGRKAQKASRQRRKK